MQGEYVEQLYIWTQHCCSQPSFLMLFIKYFIFIISFLSVEYQVPFDLNVGPSKGFPAPVQLKAGAQGNRDY